ncbi:branched-chain amino acid ABC transporter permease [Cupriavidus numazuensis]|uniref:High-affinity branched-chain amino acid transport system permease protein LivH n=1 Tax=Cupriavidus numazuensis TaxID=221992 RepID=A0ABM8TGJ0_9BURK|nr:branched-chain amino acid ABC transporter permease [Cupriavidus numazuensis]CAG2144959.1 High-affinity branched-chain amino acid transport system permease protein LivH [Cupriavidus numazuensis]
MELLVAQLINGLTIGSTYALVALGIVLIFSVLDVLSVAQGEIFIASAYAGFVWFYRHVSPDLVLCSAFVIVTSLAIGLVTERLAIRPALHGGHRATLITSVGVGLILSNGIQILAGPDAQPIPNDAATVALFRVAGVDVTRIALASVLALALGFGALKFMTERTRTGALVRAVAEDSETAAAMGVNVRRVRAATFAAGCVLAGMAAVLLGLKYGNLTPNLGASFSLTALTAAVIGGASRVEGAVLVSFVLGIAETLTTTYLGADFTLLVQFSLFFVVLLAMPEGIFRRTYRRAG